jgi:hypothetical protein
MAHTNTDLRIYYKEEDNYAGGDGGAEFSETHATATAGYSIMNFLAGKVKLGAKIFKRKKLKTPGYGAAKGLMVTTGVEFPSIEIPFYQQGFLDTLGVEAVAGTEGAAGTSYTFNVVISDPTSESDSETWSIFGAQMTEFTISGKNDDEYPPIITVKFTCYSLIKDTGAVDFSGISFNSTIVQEFEDYSMEIDDTTITELLSFNFKILKKFTEIGKGRNGSLDRFKPMLIEHKVECEIQYLKEEGIVSEDPYLETINKDVKIELFTGLGTGTPEEFDVTNCYAVESNMFDKEGNKIDIEIHKIKYESGDSAISQVAGVDA